MKILKSILGWSMALAFMWLVLLLPVRWFTGKSFGETVLVALLWALVMTVALFALNLYAAALLRKFGSKKDDAAQNK
jgi:uncharacterized membrane protein